MAVTTARAAIDGIHLAHSDRCEGDALQDPGCSKCVAPPSRLAARSGRVRGNGTPKVETRASHPIPSLDLDLTSHMRSSPSPPCLFPFQHNTTPDGIYWRLAYISRAAPFLAAAHHTPTLPQ